MNDHLSPIKDVYQLLKEKIMIGELKPNEQLNEAVLAKKLGADELEVRKAFKKLDEIGFVKLIPFSGTFVTPISLEEIKELFEYRCSIELNALTKFLSNMNQIDIEVLADTIDLMRKAVARNDFWELHEYDMYFHKYIIKRSKKPISLKLWSRLDLHVRRFIAEAHLDYYNDLEAIAEAHVPLLEALKSKDINLAKKLFCEHVSMDFVLAKREH